MQDIVWVVIEYGYGEPIARVFWQEDDARAYAKSISKYHKPYTVDRCVIR